MKRFFIIGGVFISMVVCGFFARAEHDCKILLIQREGNSWKILTVQETQTQITKNITPKEAHTLILQNKNISDFVILDVRTPREFLNRHIENAVNLDYYSEIFEDRLNNMDKNKKYLIYCRSGARSGSALSIMKELKFVEVYNMLGGIDRWEAEGFPITPISLLREDAGSAALLIFGDHCYVAYAMLV